MIEKVTEAMVSVEGENLREKTVVILRKSRVATGELAAKTLSTHAVKQLRESR